MILSPADRDALLFKAARDRRLQRSPLAVPVLLVMLERLRPDIAQVFEVGRIAKRLDRKREAVRRTLDQLTRAGVITLEGRDYLQRGIYLLNVRYDPPVPEVPRRKWAGRRPPSLSPPLPGTAA